MSLGLPILREGFCDDPLMPYWRAWADFPDETKRDITITAGARLEAVHGLACALTGQSAVRPPDEDLGPLWEAVRSHDYVWLIARWEIATLEATLFGGGHLPVEYVQNAIRQYVGLLDIVLTLYERVCALDQADLIARHPLTSIARDKCQATTLVSAPQAECLGCADLLTGTRWIYPKKQQPGEFELRVDFAFDPRSLGPDDFNRWVNERAEAWLNDRQHFREIWEQHRRENDRVLKWLSDPANLTTLEREAAAEAEVTK